MNSETSTLGDEFDTALAFVLSWEGGLTVDPDDPGGRTFRGITQSEFDRWRERHGMPPEDVTSISDATLTQIYRQDYWIPANCTPLFPKLYLLQFDTSVNMGVTRAMRTLQGAAGTTVDGVWGPLTAQAVDGCDRLALVTSYCNAREEYYRALAARKRKLRKFLQGWLNRLNAVRAECGLSAKLEEYGLRPAEPMAKIPDYGVDPTYDF